MGCRAFLDSFAKRRTLVFSGTYRSLHHRSGCAAGRRAYKEMQVRLSRLLISTILLAPLPVLAHDVPAEIAKSPPAAPLAAVSSLVPLPDFLPGMGQLFV